MRMRIVPSVAGMALVTLGFSLGAHSEIGACYGKHQDIVVYGGSWYAHWTQEAASSIRVLRLDTRAESTIWGQQQPFTGLSLCPRDEFVAFLERAESQDPCLVIITLAGDLVTRIEGIHRFAWDPKGGRVAYITGVGTEGGLGFLPTGVWVYDVASRTNWRIHPGGYDLTWPSFDERVYVWTIADEGQPCVFRCAADGQNAQATPYQGIRFSPDGIYYYCARYEGNLFRLFRREGNTDVTANWPFLAFRADSGETRGWLDAHTLIFPSRSASGRRERLLDLRTGAVREAMGKVIARTSDGSELLLLAPGGITTQAVTSLESVPPEAVDPSTPPASAPASLQYRVVGDVPLDQKPARLLLSPSGKHLSVEYSSVSDHFLAVYTDLAAGVVYPKSLPRSRGAWHVGDTLFVRIPETNGACVALPPYNEVALFAQRVTQNPSSASDLERLAVAAWIYCENGAYDLLTDDGVPVVGNLATLSSLTRERFGEPVPTDAGTIAGRAAEGALKQLVAASEVYLMNEHGQRVHPEVHLGHGSKQLYLVEGEDKREVTAPDHRGYLQSFSFDPITMRVCVRSPRYTTVYDGRTGERRLLPRADVETRTDRICRPVPGTEYLLVEMRPSSPYIGGWLEVWDPLGERVAILDTGPRGAGAPTRIGPIASSDQLLACVLDGTTLRLFEVTRTF